MLLIKNITQITCLFKGLLIVLIAKNIDVIRTCAEKARVEKSDNNKQCQLLVYMHYKRSR